MTVLKEISHVLEDRNEPRASNEIMLGVLAKIRHNLSLDPAKTEEQIKKRLGDLATVVNHIAKSLRTKPEQLTVIQAVENESIFLEYVAKSKLSPASKTQLPSRRNAVLRYARRFGFSPESFALLDEWEPIKAGLTAKYGIPAIANYAIRCKRRPVDLSDADLAEWAGATLDSGGSYQYVRQAQSAFLTAIRKASLQNSFPQLDVAVRKLPGYRLGIESMPPTLRAEIKQIVDSRRAQKKHSIVNPESEPRDEITQCFEDLCGYATGTCGMDLIDLDPLLNEAFVRQYAFWLRIERKCKRTTVVGRLSRMFSALQSCPGFNDRDFSWRHNVYRKLRPEAESALKERRRQRHVEFQELAEIPGRMRSERLAILDGAPESSGWRIMDELLLSCLILAQWPARFISMAELGRNVFKASIPKDGPPFSVPPWAKETLLKNPNAEFWQFRYESPGGRLYRGLVLRSIVPLLELYVEENRQFLVNSSSATCLFCDRAGRPLSCELLAKLVSYKVWRYIKKRVTLTSIRSSFAYFWRDKHPGKDAVLAQIQWVDYATIKMRYDEEFRRQRRARANRRMNRYS